MNLLTKFVAAGICAAFVFLAPSSPMQAQGKRGAITDLPLPRYVSLKAARANVRRGPSLNQRVDWVFTRTNMPLEITAEYGNWRRVRDVDGAGGWVHYSLLSGVRTVVVEKDYAPLRSTPTVGSEPNAYAEQGVVAFLGVCVPLWCKISANGKRGWVLRSEIWGADIAHKDN